MKRSAAQERPEILATNRAGPWPMARLADVCAKITDGTHRSPPNGGEGIPYITAKNIRRFAIDLTDLTYVSEAHHREIYSRCDPRPGDVLYIKDGATMGIAAVNTLDFEFSMLSSVALIRPRADVLRGDYLACWLNHPETYRRVVEAQTGCAIQRMVLNDIRNMRIPVPSLAEQGGMASEMAVALGSVDQARRASQERFAAAEALPAAYLREVFEGPEASGWQTYVLGELLARPIRTGISKPTCFESDTHCLTLSAVRGRTLLLDACKPVAISESQAAGNWVQRGSFYVVRGNGNRALVGRGAFAPDTMPARVLFPDLLFELTLNPERLDPGFFGWLWSSPAVRREIEARAKTAAGIYKINTGNLNSLSLPLPRLVEQRRISAALAVRVVGAERLANGLRGEFDGINALPTALLREAFNGND
jgi:hypothetical protein